MNPLGLERFAGLYASSRYMGADRFLRRFLKITDERPMPLSLSHGVDAGQYRDALDVEAIEPIHWSNNVDTFKEAIKVKPSIVAPHPWAILAESKTPSVGGGVLLVGPPPSPENDQRLYDLIKSESLADWSVLVKVRGEHQGSIRFWNQCGLGTVSAGAADSEFYERLYSIISRYETVVGCSFSSALIFAAAIGKRVVLLRDYAWEIYDASNFLDVIWLDSPRSRSIVRVLANGSNAEQQEAARELLGFDLLSDPTKVRRDLDDAITALKRPYHSHKHNPLPYKLGETLAVALKRQGFLRYSPSEVLSVLRRKQVGILRMNDIDVWLNGRTATNCRVTPVEYRKGITEPGRAPRGYEIQKS